MILLILVRTLVVIFILVVILLYGAFWCVLTPLRYLLVCGVIILFIGCQKEDMGVLEQEKYEVRLFANGQQNFIRYNIVDFYDKKPATHFDTTFLAPGGWTLRFSVTAEQWPMNAGVVIDGVVMANCANEREFFYEHKF
jgi:hypothetical protein